MDPSEELKNAGNSKELSNDNKKEESKAQELLGVQNHHEQPQAAQQPATPGAYAMNLPAPVYIMEGEDDAEFEPIPEELLAPHVRSSMIPRGGGGGGDTVASRSDEDNNDGGGENGNQDNRDDDGHDEENKPVILDAQVQVVKLIQKEGFDDEDDKSKNDTVFCAGKRWLILGVLGLVIAVVVIVAVVASSGGGGGGGEDLSPSLSPTLTPTSTPLDPDFCYGTIFESMGDFLIRGAVADFSETWELRLCVNTEYTVTDDIFPPQPWLGDNPPIVAQSNTHVKCGKDGLLSDQCVVQHGQSLFWNAYSTQPPGEPAASNVIVEGLTFQDGLLSLIDMRSGGDITFRNCVFRVSA